MFRVVFTVLVLSLSGLVASMPTDMSLSEFSDNANSFSGTGTYYHVHSAGMRCGGQAQDSDHIVAVPTSKLGSGSLCNKTVEIHANGRKAYGNVRDACRSCRESDLVMSPSLFEEFAPLKVGVIEINWSIV